MADDGGFLSRWSQRKAQARQGPVAEPASAMPPEPVVEPAPAVAAAPVPQPAPEAPPLPTLADVARLNRDSDFSRFVAPGIDEGVKRAAMKKLFTDPHFNVMDGLDTYIDDYGKPDPIGLAMLRQMAQAQVLGLFEHEEQAGRQQAAAPPATRDPEPEPPSDDDPDLRLQQDHAAGRPGPGQGPGA